MADSNREKALHLALGSIEKAYGKGSIMRLGDADAKIEVPVVPTGAISLDLALGIGGYPRGRIVEIYGPESSGKTTLTLHAIAECQKKGGIAAFIDAEHALDPSYARKLGVNVDELLVSQPDHGEQALEIADTLVRSGAVDIIVIDSVAALVPRAEIEGEMGDSHVGLQARLMSQALRKLTGTVQKSNTTLFFINQIRMKIGVMFGSPDFGKGISRTGDVLDLGVEAGLIQKSGAWYSYGEERVGQGRDNARNFLEEHPDVLAQIERKLLQKHGLIKEDTPAEPKAEAKTSAAAPTKGGAGKRARPN
jgi:recombination protein RecA